MDNMIVSSGIGKCYGTGKEEFWALKDVSLEIPKGTLTILKGKSGSGKTTLLNILSTLDTPSTGSILFEGRDIIALSDAERTKLRRTEVGFVFQSIDLIPMMTALENVEFALRMAGQKNDRKARAMECLKRVGLSQRAAHLVQELSGGEQQRVAIARAIAHMPKVLFADEPTGALDTNSGISVVQLFKKLVEEEGVTVVMTTHDPGLMEFGDRVYELEGGMLVHGE